MNHATKKLHCNGKIPSSNCFSKLLVQYVFAELETYFYQYYIQKRNALYNNNDKSSKSESNLGNIDSLTKVDM